jgi:hypothetical protein
VGHAAIHPAVVEAGDDHGAVDVVAQKAHQHFLPDAGDELVAHARGLKRCMTRSQQLWSLLARSGGAKGLACQWNCTLTRPRRSV